MVDYAKWADERAREEERAKAQQLLQAEKIETIKRFLGLGLCHEDVAQGAGVDVSIVKEVASEI